jgi:hypothetical protein
MYCYDLLKDAALNVKTVQLICTNSQLPGGKCISVNVFFQHHAALSQKPALTFSSNNWKLFTIIIFRLLLEIFHACSLFHEKGDILVFEPTEILLLSWLSGKVSAQHQYGREFMPHSAGL